MSMDTSVGDLPMNISSMDILLRLSMHRSLGRLSAGWVGGAAANQEQQILTFS